MSDAVEAVDNALVAEWVEHPVSRFNANMLRLELANSLARLEGHARTSTDPACRGEAYYLASLRKSLRLLTEKPEDKGEDGELRRD